MNLTKKEKFAALLNIEAVANNAELVEWINHEIELLSKPRAKKPSKAHVENESLAETVVNAMQPNTLYTTKDLCALIPDLGNLSTQKVTAIMKAAAGIEKVREKGKLYYTLAE